MGAIASPATTIASRQALLAGAVSLAGDLARGGDNVRDYTCEAFRTRRAFKLP